MDRTLSSATTPGQSGHGINDKISKDYLMSYLEHSLGVSYLYVESQSAVVRERESEKETEREREREKETRSCLDDDIMYMFYFSGFDLEVKETEN